MPSSSSSSPSSTQVKELDPVSVEREGSSSVEQLRCFSLTTCSNDVTVELCSVGASITKILLPRVVDDQQQQQQQRDDVVLGYPSPATLLDNPLYFSAIVGRVANRIAHGKFVLNDGQEYQLALNSGPNHLHGGVKGFSHKIWDATIVPNGLQFSLISPDGEEGYPGAIKVVATYTLLQHQPTSTTTGAATTTLRLDMEATLLEDQTLSTPISLSQHSYFNLAGHDAAHGILDHTLWMPHCLAYTPKDAVTSIPTRHVKRLQNDAAMDWRCHHPPRLIRDGLIALAMQHEGLTKEKALDHIHQRLASSRFIAKSAVQPTEPYGFDHNYVVDTTAAAVAVEGHDDDDDDASHLPVVAVLEHAASKRRMTVRSNAPGVQVYTANYLDGGSSSCVGKKEKAIYGQWQGICLETQYYPDSILTTTLEEQELFPDFAKGKCFILQPGGNKYQHIVEYEFESLHEEIVKKAAT